MNISAHPMACAELAIAGLTAPAPTEVRRGRRHWRPIATICLRALLIVLVVRLFFGEASVVPTGSMERTIMVGDHLFWVKLPYGPEIPFTHWRLPRLKSVRRGDIVAFHYPRDPRQIFLKRVVAIGGDQVEMRQGALFVNGRAVTEGYAMRGRAQPSRAGEMNARTVPAGQLFVMGDNRDNSSDSREWGPVPEANVIGEPLFVIWSYDAPPAAWLDPDFSHQLRFSGSMLTHLFSRTRWSRTGLPVS
jgi:signal peptidase I